MLSCSVLTSPHPRPTPWYGMVPPDPGPRHNVPRLGYSRLLTFHMCLLFPHLVKFLANTMQFNTTCKDYDSMNQHSHQATRTTGPQGGRGANHDHAQRGRSDAGAYMVPSSGRLPPVCCFRDAMYPEAYMSLELHDAHEFAWLTAPIRYPAAQDLHPR